MPLTRYRQHYRRRGMTGHRCNEHNTKDCIDCADKRIAELEAQNRDMQNRVDHYLDFAKQMEKKVGRLEKIETVARQLTDGSHPCFVSNHEKCKHDRYGYEGCEQCYDEALLAALEGKQE